MKCPTCGRCEVTEEDLEKIVCDVYYEALGEKVTRGELHNRVAKAILQRLRGEK